MSEPHNHEKLTGAQNEAINKAWELLREHFEAVITAQLLATVRRGNSSKHEALEEPESSQPD
jgi:hypothetical protein